MQRSMNKQNKRLANKRRLKEMGYVYIETLGWVKEAQFEKALDWKLVHQSKSSGVVSLREYAILQYTPWQIFRFLHGEVDKLHAVESKVDQEKKKAEKIFDMFDGM